MANQLGQDLGTGNLAAPAVVPDTTPAAGSITTAMLADRAVTTVKIDFDAVTEAEIAALAVSTGKIQDASVTGAKINATSVTAALNVATTSLQGVQSAVDKVRADAVWQQGLRQGANLGNADATIEPFTDQKSLYVLPAATLTANRTITLGNTSAPGAGLLWFVYILRNDLTAFTLTIKKADGTTIYTDPASPTTPRILQFYCSSGVWTANTGWFVNG